MSASAEAELRKNMAMGVSASSVSSQRWTGAMRTAAQAIASAAARLPSRAR